MAGTDLVVVPAAKRGRPSTFDPAVADEIIERLGNGEMLTVICEPEGMPSPASVYSWKDTHAEFSIRFVRARAVGWTKLAEDTVKIADTPVMGYEAVDEETTDEETDNTGETSKSKSKVHTRRSITKREMLGHRRLQIETRLKLIAMMDPARFGNSRNPDDYPGDKDKVGGPAIRVEGGLPPDEEE